MLDVVDCDTVCDILLRDDIDYQSKVWISKGNDSNHIEKVYETSALPFVFVIHRW